MVGHDENQFDCRIVGRSHLTVVEAIERALEETDRPLDATEIGHILLQREWTRPLARDIDEVVRNGIRLAFRKGNKMGILVMGTVAKKRKYWLGRKGSPPAMPEDLASRVSNARNRAAIVSQQLDQTLAASHEVLARAAEAVAKLQRPT